MPLLPHPQQLRTDLVLTLSLWLISSLLVSIVHHAASGLDYRRQDRLNISTEAKLNSGAWLSVSCKAFDNLDATTRCTRHRVGIVQIQGQKQLVFLPNDHFPLLLSSPRNWQAASVAVSPLLGEVC